MNVKTFKMLNGDELVAETTISAGFVFATNTLIMQMMIHPETNKPFRAFADWPALAAPGQTLEIPISSLLCLPVAAHEELERQYTSNITGLELPPVQPKILLG